MLTILELKYIPPASRVDSKKFIHFSPLLTSREICILWMKCINDAIARCRGNSFLQPYLKFVLIPV